MTPWISLLKWAVFHMKIRKCTTRIRMQVAKNHILGIFHVYAKEQDLTLGLNINYAMHEA